MSDRDHLEALVFAIEDLAKDEQVKYTIYSSAPFQRVLNTVKRARKDLLPPTER